jgi:hypothetical protein
MNTYDEAGSVGTNGGNMADELDHGEVQKTLTEEFLHRITSPDLEAVAVGLFLGYFGYLLLSVGISLIVEGAVLAIFAGLLLSGFALVLFIGMIVIFVALYYLLTTPVDPEGEYIIVGQRNET